MTAIAEITTAAIAATSSMTLFSYAVADSAHRQYREPALLESLLKPLMKGAPRMAKIVAAWAVHYCIGLAFTALFYMFHQKGLYDINWASGLVFGCTIGLTGMAGWKLFFSLRPDIRPSGTAGYFIQLFIAHLLFAATTVTVHVLFLP